MKQEQSKHCRKILQMSSSLITLAITIGCLSINAIYHHLSSEDQASNSFHLLKDKGLKIHDEVTVHGDKGEVVGLPDNKVAVKFDASHHETVDQDEVQKVEKSELKHDDTHESKGTHPIKDGEKHDENPKETTKHL